MNRDTASIAKPPLSGLAQLIDAAAEHLKILGYRDDTCRQYQQVWSALHQYAREVTGTNMFSQALAENFLASVELSMTMSMKSLPFARRYCLRAVRVLTEFYFHGCFHHWRPSALYPALPPDIQIASERYKEYCRNSGIRERTIHSRILMIRKLAVFMSSRGKTKPAELDAALLSDFIASQSRYNANSVCLLVRNLRLFLRHLHQAQHHELDLSSTLPRIPGRFRDLLPTTWTKEDVERLLACVDRDSPVGKRDYAILLLAARLGMRSSDIVTLQLEHIHWDEERIRKVQSKTGVPLDVPLLEDVGLALIDYLKNARPKTPYREVFLRFVAPIRPFDDGGGLSSLIERYRLRAGISVPPESRRGMHALRHAVASHLLEQGTPLTVISGVLGHVDANSTRIYTKVDIERLRQCALEVMEIHHA